MSTMAPARRRRETGEDRALAQIHYEAVQWWLEKSGIDVHQRGRGNAREKLMGLKGQQFQELSTDVYDELRRRTAVADGDADAVPFLPVRGDYHPKRNQARQKLATLSDVRFGDLTSDVFVELERRYPEFANHAAPVMSARDMVIPTKGRMALDESQSPEEDDSQVVTPRDLSALGNGWIDPKNVAQSPYSQDTASWGPSGPWQPASRGASDLMNPWTQQKQQPDMSPYKGGGSFAAESAGGSFLGGASMNGESFPGGSVNGESPNTGSLNVESFHNGSSNAESFAAGNLLARGNSVTRSSPMGSSPGPPGPSSSANAELEDLRLQLTQALSSHELTKGELRQLEATAQSSSARVRSLEARAFDAEGRATDAEARVTELERRLMDSERKCADLESRVIDTESLIQEAEARASDAEGEVRRLDAHIHDLEGQISTHKTRVTEHATALQSARSELDALTQRHNKVQADAQESFSRSLQDIDSHRRRAADAHDMADQLRREVTTLTDELRALQSRQDALTDAKDRALFDVRAANEKIADLTRQLDKASSVTLTPPIKLAPQLFAPQGGIQVAHVAAFQQSIDDLLSVARSKDPSAVLGSMRTVVAATTHISEDAQDVTRSSNTATVRALALNQDDVDLIHGLRAKTSHTLSNLVNAARNHATSFGMSPVSLLDAAASHLSATIVDLVRLLKVADSDADKNGKADFANARVPSSSDMNLRAAPASPPHVAAQSFPTSGPRDDIDTASSHSPPAGDSMDTSRQTDVIDDLRSYLEVQTESIVFSIQSLLSSIRLGHHGAQLNENLTQIITIVSSIVAISKEALPPAMKHEGDPILADLVDNCEKLSEMQGESGAMTRQVKQSMAAASFGVAKSLKSLNALLVNK